MPTYQRHVWVDAPLDEVWEFHSRVEGLEALTPSWMNLRVETVYGPDGERDPELLEEGAEAHMSLQPFGVGPRQSWVSHVTKREREDDHAVFEDEMADGPFPSWTHTHRFYAEDGGTVVWDTVEYELPLVGGKLGSLGWVGFEPMFRERHKRTKRILESESESGPSHSDSHAEEQRPE
ncbi:SRPBCC family protein [Halorussus halophilus]|uniref:SRPBCC family protein n=1 Tax=Halorussus halophilus TaxID=2650975 RepID=UPI001300ED4F|nr:SRPBCC family protein [Halorussus halophilus]